MKNKITQSKIALLPSGVVKDIQALGLTKIQEKKCYHLISIIRNKSRQDNGNYYSYTEIPSAYLKKVFTEKYNSTVNILKQAGIIICDNNYTFGSKSKSLCYKINDLYIDLVQYSSISFNRVLLESNADYQRNRELFKMDIQKLNINTKKLLEITMSRVDNLSINDFKTNTDITEEIIYVCFKNGNFETRYVTNLEKALATAEEHNFSLIQDKRKFFLMNEEKFIMMKKDFLLNSYKDSIDKIEKEYWYAARNKTNNRLDSNITNMCGELMDEIITSNNLVQLDLSNSQFAILSHIIPSEVVGDDIKLFKQLSYSGELYDYIKEVLFLETRKQAKQVTFELLFSSHRNKSKKLKLLKEFFPNLIDWINQYKKYNGNEQFAIMLQKEESTMFIDHIWTELKKKKLFALTKHDCIICKKEDEQEVTEFIQMYFDSIGFAGIIKK